MLQWRAMARVPDRLVKLAQELVSVPTPAGREDRLLPMVEQELAQAGLAVRRQAVPGAGENVLASRGEGGPLFLAHLDVFPAYEHPNAFAPRLHEGELIGRGAVDTKGQIAALLLALSSTTGSAEVALVVDEEHLGRGSESLEVPPGTPAHGTMPWRGNSAIEHGFSLYRRLRRLSIMKHRHLLFDRGAWVNLGRISGGYDTMVVPNRCELDLDIGFAPGLAAAAVEAEVREALSTAEAFQITDIWEPWETDPGEQIVVALTRAFHSCGRRTAPQVGNALLDRRRPLGAKGAPHCGVRGRGSGHSSPLAGVASVGRAP